MVDGSILAAALLAIESDRRPSLPAAAGSVGLAVAVLWLSHTYSAALGDRLHRAAPWSVRHLVDTAWHEARILQGALVPVAALLLAAAFGAGDQAAVLAGLISAIGLLLVLELAAAVASRRGPATLVAQVALSVTIGAGVMALKVIAH